VLDLWSAEHPRPDYAEMFAPYIKRALEHKPDEGS